MTNLARKPIPIRQPEQAIAWNEYPRIEPGTYRAYCKFAKQYRDPAYRRWTCLLKFEVLSDDLTEVIATVPRWFALGSGEKPQAGRRGSYLPEWVKANGGPPQRRDRLSPLVFCNRMARVEIADNKSPAPYSVVAKIVEWETGNSGSLSQLVTQSRKAWGKPMQRE